MKAQAYLITNLDEIDKAEKLGISVPGEVQELVDFYFHIDDVVSAYIASDDTMIICIAGMAYIFKYNRKVFTEIAKHLGG